MQKQFEDNVSLEYHIQRHINKDSFQCDQGYETQTNVQDNHSCQCSKMIIYTCNIRTHISDKHTQDGYGNVKLLKTNMIFHANETKNNIISVWRISIGWTLLT